MSHNIPNDELYAVIAVRITRKGMALLVLHNASRQECVLTAKGLNIEAALNKDDDGAVYQAVKTVSLIETAKRWVQELEDMKEVLHV